MFPNRSHSSSAEVDANAPTAPNVSSASQRKPGAREIALLTVLADLARVASILEGTSEMAPEVDSHGINYRVNDLLARTKKLQERVQHKYDALEKR